MSRLEHRPSVLSRRLYANRSGKLAKQHKNNQGAALANIRRVLVCARRVAVHCPARGDVARVAEVPGRKLHDLRLALKQAGVDMAKARNNSAGAYQARKVVKAKRKKHS